LDYYLMVIADLGHYLPAGDSEIQIIRGTERIDKPHRKHSALAVFGYS